MHFNTLLSPLFICLTSPLLIKIGTTVPSMVPCLKLDPLEAEPETRIQGQVVYLRGRHRMH